MNAPTAGAGGPGSRRPSGVPEGQRQDPVTGDRSQLAGVDGASAGSGLRGADLVPQLVRVQAALASQPGQVRPDPGSRMEPGARWASRNGARGFTVGI
jgi:hypothetical protein